MTTGEELTKRCADCETVKAVSQFSRNNTRGDGYQHICKACSKIRYAAQPKKSWTNAARAERKAAAEARRNTPKLTAAEKSRIHREKNPDLVKAARKRAYTKQYGLTPEEYDAKFAEQHGQCAICLIDLPDRPHIDHDHYNGRTRSLLCQQCNCGIGMLQDSPDVLRRAADYIDFWNIVHESAELRVE